MSDERLDSRERSAAEDDLTRALDAFRAYPRTVHVVALALLLVAGMLRYGPDLLALEPRVDEQTYLDAFERAARGASPFDDPDYLYPQVFAITGGWVHAAVGESATMVLLRAAVLGGAALLVWLAVAAWPETPTHRLLLAIVLLALSPGFKLGFQVANLSSAIIALILLGLFAWPRRPVGAGLALGLATGLKPMAPPALAALAAVRGSSRPGRSRLAVGVAGAVAAALIVLPPNLGELLSRDLPMYQSLRVASWARVFETVGMPISAAVVMVGITVATFVATAVASRRVRLTAFEILAIGVAASCLAQPAAWSHTLLLALPVQVAALTRLRQRWRQGAARWVEVLFVAALIPATHGVAGVNGAVGEASWVVVAAIVPPLVATPALAAYLLRTRPEERPTDEARGGGGGRVE